jgi:hypothetical protein
LSAFIASKTLESAAQQIEEVNEVTHLIH